mmetsp:Transcript_150/g.177  ORF Transcript_150/g.177 Transcript_150/m.177 type:complete len:84 (+) Transcript_150:612-863(+)
MRFQFTHVRWAFFTEKSLGRNPKRLASKFTPAQIHMHKRYPRFAKHKLNATEICFEVDSNSSNIDEKGWVISHPIRRVFQALA